MKKLYQYQINNTEEYEYVSQSSKYIFHNRLECKENSKPMKLKIENLNKDLGLGGVYSFDEYNDEIHSMLIANARSKVELKQVAINNLQRNIDSLQEDIDECNEFINTGRTYESNR